MNLSNLKIWRVFSLCKVFICHAIIEIIYGIDRSLEDCLYQFYKTNITCMNMMRCACEVSSSVEDFCDKCWDE